MSVSFNTILKDVTSLLNKELPMYLSYHNTAHTLYVLDRAIHIAKKEKVNSKDLELIKLAALYHDIGFIKTNVEHEKEGCKIAEKQLLDYGYAREDIAVVCGMIMATKIPQNPKNLLEQIIADADLEYLATSNYQKIAHNLFLELQQYNPRLTTQKWKTIQLNFLKEHHYYTKYCRHYKTFRKLKNIKQLKRML
ncbi:HD domain-containing protein [Ichthyenterobacterium magnum]|uniref:Putative nucleotidyltransferase with HDIG domain n=1 Tax=Ichthyenterobacterium magnum TaxID=1230530 RepID=A0A420DM08_9FLAO|nr:HD domain-containing protein [Ichthyenterobacterium magnum]RKE95241.1 putative nucleotidyltransferase with HDIG domain [Ichthyenterobacterium magnum]